MYILLIVCTILFFILLCFCIHTKVESFHPKSQDIDIVITWVDGKNVDFKNEVETLIGGGCPLDRFDSNNELLFCLRSIEKFCPWIRKIFIVCRDDQWPSFLKPSHFQIEKVSHFMIIPPVYLPTYNSLVIENYLHKIPNLSEHFIYFNDDMILLKYISPEYFFDRKNFYPIHTLDKNKSIIIEKFHYWVKSTEENRIIPISLKLFTQSFSLFKLVQQNVELLQCVFGKDVYFRNQHVPYAMKKTFCHALDDFLKSVELENHSLYEHTSVHPFRNLKSVARYSIFQKYWNIKMYECQSIHYPLFSLIINDKRDITLQLQKILKTNDTFLIIHNESKQNNEIYRENIKTMNSVLSTLFPNKSSFEN